MWLAYSPLYGMVEIGLTDLPKCGGAMAPPGTTGLYVDGLVTMQTVTTTFKKPALKVRATQYSQRR